jgi:hypothetical protein
MPGTTVPSGRRSSPRRWRDLPRRQLPRARDISGQGIAPDATTRANPKEAAATPAAKNRKIISDLQSRPRGIYRRITSSVDLSQSRSFQRARVACVVFAHSLRRRVRLASRVPIERIGTKSQGGMSCGMLWYFSQQSCCFARHWFPTTLSPGAAAALGAEVVASMVPGAFMAVVDATLRRGVLVRATRSRVGRVAPSRVAQVVR